MSTPHIIMYIRFVVPQFCDTARAEFGFFRAAYALARFKEPQYEPWYQAELARELAWFDDHLDVPDRLNFRASRHRRLWGVCWFDPSAGEHINRARYICWLLGELGLATKQIRLHRPGRIIWRDAHQVVAAPGRDMPSAFH